jgi:tRNA threonylcarbamoyladenosine biosynthesis protein TsaB
MALPYHVPLIGVPTLDVVAYPFQDAGRPVWAIVQAGRGKIGVAGYDWVEGKWTQTAPPRLTTLEGLCGLVTTPAILSGEVDEHEVSLLRQQLGQDVTIPPLALRLRRPAYLAELAALRLAQNDVDDTTPLAPIYLQHPPAGS